MELVNPPADFGACFADGEVVETSVGFGDLISTHCAFSSPMLQFQKGLYKDLAGLMRDAGLAPSLQFGEFCWWYFTNLREDNPGGGMGYYDEETEAAAQTALGRPLHLFSSPEDDPQANGGADSTFLRNRLRDHVAALAAHIRGAYPAAKLEVLFPFDVNYPTPAGVHQIGGRLNRFVNFPVEWENKATSGLDRMKIEALDFGAWSRDLELSRAAVRFGVSLNWPKDSLRHLLPVFQPGYAWRKECQTALGEGVPAVTLWAFDHICLFGIDPHPAPGRASSKRF
jgi:hypothetical protein